VSQALLTGYNGVTQDADAGCSTVRPPNQLPPKCDVMYRRASNIMLLLYVVAIT